jgi:hypothetical protein
MSEVDAKRIAVETNETRFDSDKKALDDLVREILSAHVDAAETLPYTNDYLALISEIDSPTEVASVILESELDELRRDFEAHNSFRPLEVRYSLTLKCNSNDSFVTLMKRFEEIGVKSARIDGEGLVHDGDDLLAHLVEG